MAPWPPVDILSQSTAATLLPSMENIARATKDEKIRILLLESEHIIHIEFIECAVPLFYIVYLLILFHLLNAKFYPEMANLDSASLVRTVRNISVYAILAFVSLLYVHFFLRWKLKISALHMLANVLEGDIVVVQSVTVLWVVFVLQLPLQHSGLFCRYYLSCGLIIYILHLGVDFSLKFQWS